MDLSRGQALHAAATAAKLAADDALHRSTDREREREHDEDEFDQVKQTLNDAENADTSKGRNLDGDRVSEIRSLLAQGGDKAVAKKFGDSALASPEAAKAKAQRAAISKRESMMAREAISAATAESGKTSFEVNQKARPSLRDQMIERERQERSARGEQTAPTGQRSLLSLRDQMIEREHRERDRGMDSRGR